MVRLATVVLGPLAGPECRRAVARGWLFGVRTLGALAPLGTVLVVIWTWWFSRQFDPGYRPLDVLHGGLGTLEGMAVTVALVMSPAVLAGSLAGEKARGSLGLLLTTRVTAREIVTARLAGKLSQVGLILLAGLPALVLLAALAGATGLRLALLIALPAAVAFGGGGLAAAASAMARRGRDALLGVYLLDLVLLLSPLVGFNVVPASARAWIDALNPYRGVSALAWDEAMSPALIAAGSWAALGLLGAAVASWRLRPACLRSIAGASHPGRRGRVPPLGDRPMLWKELHIERVGTLGRFGRWLGLLIVAALAGGSSVLAGIAAWSRWVQPDPAWETWAVGMLSDWIGGSSQVIAGLVECAIGLRAAVAIAAERERGTWDSLLTSPLEGRAIIGAKLWGTLYALRWLGAAALLAWALAAGWGAMALSDTLSLIADVIVIGGFMAAVGVRTSLAAPTGTRAMAVTIGIWLGAWAALAVAAAIIVLMLAMVFVFGWLIAALAGLAGWTSGPWFPLSFETTWTLVRLALYGLITVLVVSEARLRFDRLAGRMAGGEAAVAVDRIIHGRPMAPVPIGPRSAEIGRDRPCPP